MWAFIMAALRDSKKAGAAIAAVLVAIAAKVGLDLPVEAVAAIISPILVYIHSQGQADRGKEAVKESNKPAKILKPKE